jgi:hypothetical protein
MKLYNFNIRGFFIASLAIELYLVKSTKFTSRSGSLRRWGR